MVVVPAWAVNDRRAIVKWLDGRRDSEVLVSEVCGQILRLDRRYSTARVQESRVLLSRQEFLLLESLMLNAGTPMSTVELIEAVWGDLRAATPTTLRVLVHRLRETLRPLVGSAVGSPVGTVRGAGYRWVSDI
jgi:DNA-binding response OmpR family regulator